MNMEMILTWNMHWYFLFRQKVSFTFSRFDKEEEITVDWAVDAKIPEGR